MQFYKCCANIIRWRAEDIAVGGYLIKLFSSMKLTNCCDAYFFNQSGGPGKLAVGKKNGQTHQKVIITFFLQRMKISSFCRSGPNLCHFPFINGICMSFHLINPESPITNHQSRISNRCEPMQRGANARTLQGGKACVRGKRLFRSKWHHCKNITIKPSQIQTEHPDRCMLHHARVWCIAFSTNLPGAIKIMESSLILFWLIFLIYLYITDRIFIWC
jgi:hypothetical protein